jgi:hypothetical protein
MSKKKDRAWYVCPQLADLLLRHYASDTAAAQALKTEAKVIAKLRSGLLVARSSLRRVLQRYANGHRLSSSVDELMIDVRSRWRRRRDAAQCAALRHETVPSASRRGGFLHFGRRRG